MIDYAKFLKDNGLKQRDIVNMLGVSKPFVSQIVHGLANLSSEKLDELIKKSNLLGYDVSMLTNTPSINASLPTTAVRASQSTKATLIRMRRLPS